MPVYPLQDFISGGEKRKRAKKNLSKYWLLHKAQNFDTKTKGIIQAEKALFIPFNGKVTAMNSKKQEENFIEPASLDQTGSHTCRRIFPD